MVDRSEQEQQLEQLKFNSRLVILEAATNIAGELIDDLEAAGSYLAKSPGIGPRGETDFPQLESMTPAQIAEVRSGALRLGIGAPEGIGLKESGMPEGTTVIAEGGLPNKILAQLKMITDNERKPGMIALSASQTRIAGQSDVKRMEQISAHSGKETPDISGKTELELAAISASFLPDFEAYEEPVVLPFGYDLYDGGISPNDEASGQAIQIGEINGSPVVIIGVRECHRDDSGKNFFRPSVAHLKEFARDIATHFDESAADLPVATVTSNLYGPSRRLQNPDTLTYGTKVMAEVVGEEAASPSIENIVSELDRTREVLLEQGC